MNKINDDASDNACSSRHVPCSSDTDTAMHRIRGLVTAHDTDGANNDDDKRHQDDAHRIRGLVTAHNTPNLVDLAGDIVTQPARGVRRQSGMVLQLSVGQSTWQTKTGTTRLTMRGQAQTYEIPRSLIDAIPEDARGHNSLKQFGLMLGFIARKQFVHEDADWAYISSRWLNAMLGCKVRFKGKSGRDKLKASPIAEFIKEDGIIIQPSKGKLGKCLGYQLTNVDVDELDDDPFVITFVNPATQASESRGRELLKNALKNVVVDIDGLNAEIATLSSQRPSKDPEQQVWRSRRNQLKMILWATQGRQDPTLNPADSFGNRHHTLLTSLPKQYRHLLWLKNDGNHVRPVEVDVVNCQLLLMLVVFKATYQRLHLMDIEEGVDWIIKHANDNRTQMPSWWDELWEATQAGTGYTKLAELLNFDGDVVNNDEDRARFKQDLMFPLMFSKMDKGFHVKRRHTFEEGKGEALTTIQQQMPELYEWMLAMADVSFEIEDHRKPTDGKFTVYLCQQLESRLLLGTACNQLAEHTMSFYSIHDALFVPPQHAEACIEAIRDAFLLVGAQVTVNRKDPQ